MINGGSLIRFCIWLNVLLVCTYVTLIAVVMSYAALHIEFAEGAKQGEAEVATLEASYFSALSRLTATDYRALGYAQPTIKRFVTGTETLSVR